MHRAQSKTAGIQCGFFNDRDRLGDSVYLFYGIYDNFLVLLKSEGEINGSDRDKISILFLPGPFFFLFTPV